MARTCFECGSDTRRCNRLCPRVQRRNVKNALETLRCGLMHRKSMEEAKGPVWRIDLTLPGRESEIRWAPLHEQWTYLLKAFQKWKRILPMDVCGGFRCIEVTRNEDNGWWHLHLHLLVEFLHDPEWADTCSSGTSSGEWSQYAQRAGLGERCMARPAASWEIGIQALNTDDHYLAKSHYLAKENSAGFSQRSKAEFLHTMKNKRLWDCFGDWRGSKQKHNLKHSLLKSSRDGLPVPQRLNDQPYPEQLTSAFDTAADRHFVHLAEMYALDHQMDLMRTVNPDQPDTALLHLLYRPVPTSGIHIFDWVDSDLFLRYSRWDNHAISNLF